MASLAVHDQLGRYAEPRRRKRNGIGRPLDELQAAGLVEFDGFQAIISDGLGLSADNIAARN